MKVKELKWVVDQLIESGAEDFEIRLSEEEITDFNWLFNV